MSWRIWTISLFDYTGRMDSLCLNCGDGSMSTSLRLRATGSINPLRLDWSARLGFSIGSTFTSEQRFRSSQKIGPQQRRPATGKRITQRRCEAGAGVPFSKSFERSGFPDHDLTTIISCQIFRFEMAR
jgi:hypothetical protein